MFKFGFLENQKEVQQAETTPETKCEFDDLEIAKEFPRRISYTTHKVGNTMELPRRDLFDVKFELMGKQNISSEEQILLGDEDVKTNLYEGGFKVWEGALDLVKVVENQNPKNSILELGAGAAVPGCACLYKAITSKQPLDLVLADYNRSVLLLITIPNVLLTWMAARERLHEAVGELDLNPELVDECINDLRSSQINVRFLSGGWSETFSQTLNRTFELVLASETIYNPKSLGQFTSVLRSSLTPQSVAYVAAKRIYFGVGGDVHQFEEKLKSFNMNFETVLEDGEVGRVVLRVSA